MASNRLTVWTCLFVVIALGFSTRVHSDEINLDSSARISKVGFLLSSLHEERYKHDIASVKKAALENGMDVFTENSNGDAVTERQRFESLLAKGVQVILFQATNPDYVQDLVQMAHKENVKVVAYDREIKRAKVDGSVVHDSRQIGVLQGRAALDHFSNKPSDKLEVLILAGPAGQPVADEIAEGVSSVLNNNPRVKILKVVRTDRWSPTLALAAVRIALQGSKTLNTILASNSSMALAALQAVKDFHERLKAKTSQKTEANQIEIFIAGADADLSSLQALAKNQIQFEVFKDFNELAEKAIFIAKNVSYSEKEQANSTLKTSTKPLRVILPVYGIDRKNLDQIIREKHMYSHSEVFGENL